MQCVMEIVERIRTSMVSDGSVWYVKIQTDARHVI